MLTLLYLKGVKHEQMSTIIKCRLYLQWQGL